MIKTGVYLIFNIITTQVYIGSSATSRGIAQRFIQHRHTLRNNKHGNSKLQRSWNKYGENAFLFTPIEFASPEVCIVREQFWLDRLSPYFNIAPRAGNCLGVKHSDETRKNMSIANIGKKASPETILKMSGRIGAKNPNSRPVFCAELDKKFESASLATKFLRETTHPKASHTAIAKCSREQNGYSRAYGFTWWHISPETESKMTIAQKRLRIVKKFSIERRLKMSLHTGAKNPCSKPVLCVELNRTFESANLATKYFRETMNPKAAHSSIAACARGVKNSAHGFHWKYI